MTFPPPRLSSFLFFPLLAVELLIFGGCAPVSHSPGSNDGKPVLSASIEPHAFLLERIGGERVRVEVLVPSGKEPESYQASPERVAALSRSRILFTTGMPFEESLIPKLRSLNPDLVVVDLRKNIPLRTLELHSHGEESGEGHRHHLGCSHDGLDPHIWFAPTILKTEAESVLHALLELDPEAGDFYRRRCEQLLDEIEAVRESIAEKLKPYRGETVFVFHPSYGYFCDEFGLKQKAIEFEGKSPKPQQLANLIAEARQSERETGRKPIIFVQPEFNRAPAEAIADAIGGSVVEHSCLEKDLLRSMTRFVDEMTAPSNSNR